MGKKIVLSESVELEVRGKVLKVLPLSIGKMLEISPKMAKAEKITDIAKQAEIFLAVAYDILKYSGNDVKKEELKDILTLEAVIKITQIAMGAGNV